MRALFPWLPVPFAVVLLAVWLAGGNWTLALVAAVAAAVVSAAVGIAATRKLEHRAEALAAAARGEAMLEPGVAGDPDDPDDPARLARQVQTTAKNAQEMARQLDVLRAVVDGMSEGLWITSPEGRVIQYNTALKEMLFTGAELLNRMPSEVIKSAELESAVIKACREGASTRLEVQIEGLLPRLLAVQVAPLSRELPGSAAVFQDVTELQRLEKVRKDFVANVSPELRTPITAIRGYAETLKAGALTDNVAAPKMVEIIHRQSERLSELVEDLLELSRIDAKQIQLAQKPVDIGQAATRASEAIRPKAAAKAIGVEIAMPPGLSVNADERALEQVLLNLLDNAVKYTPAGGRVRVTGIARGGEVEISVKDTGSGIEARHLSRIFERFYRVDKGRSRDMGGTGLGLSIVKNLVNQMRGDVRVESRPGEGSTFFVELPAVTAEAK